MILLREKTFAKLAGTPKAVRNTVYKVLKPGGKSSGNIAKKRRAAEKAIKAGRATEKAEIYLHTHTPGEMVADSVGLVVKDPLTAAAAATMPIPGAPTITVLIPGAKAVGKKIPGYTKFTSKMKSGYDTSKTKKLIGSVGDTIVNSFPA